MARVSITSRHENLTQKWLIGARLYLDVLKRLEGSVATREAAFVEGEYRYGRPYKNVILPVLLDLQRQDIEVQAGFAAMLGDLLATQIDGNSHDTKHVRLLLKNNSIAGVNRVGENQ